MDGDCDSAGVEAEISGGLGDNVLAAGVMVVAGQHHVFGKHLNALYALLTKPEQAKHNQWSPSAHMNALVLLGSTEHKPHGQRRLATCITTLGVRRTGPGFEHSNRRRKQKSLNEIIEKKCEKVTLEDGRCDIEGLRGKDSRKGMGDWAGRGLEKVSDVCPRYDTSLSALRSLPSHQEIFFRVRGV